MSMTPALNLSESQNYIYKKLESQGYVLIKEEFVEKEGKKYSTKFYERNASCINRIVYAVLALVATISIIPLICRPDCVKRLWRIAWSGIETRTVFAKTSFRK